MSQESPCFSWERIQYRATVTWTGSLGEGTSGYRAFSRDHEVSAEGKPVNFPVGCEPEAP